MAGITARAAFDAALGSMGGRFAWGLRRDCTAACVAFHALHGTDPLKDATAAYHNALGAYLILRRAGGYLAWCKATFDLPETDDPKTGDLALIKSADRLGAALAICIQPGEYAAKTERGLAFAPATILGAWTCHLS